MSLPLDRGLLAAAALLLALAACGDDSGPSTDNALFERYVALGGDVAAGFQSAGISSETQLAAYPVLLASGADVTFDVPLLADPGCPEPIAEPLLPPNQATSCTLQQAPGESQGQSVAVPGTRAADAVTLSAGSQLQDVMLGQRTQLQAALDIDPTFVTIHLGDDEVFDAAVSGVLGPSGLDIDSSLTRLADFEAGYTELTTELAGSTGLQGGVLIGVTDPVTYAPVLQPGAYFFLARDASGDFEGKPVNVNCSPVTLLGQPNPLSANLVSFEVLGDDAVAEINCDPAALDVESPYLLTPEEQLVLQDRVVEMNDAIEAAAERNGWLYLDPEPLMRAFLDEQDQDGRYQQIRKCQLLAAASSAAQFQAAVLDSCPVSSDESPSAAPNRFGAIWSLDGTHPSNLLHEELAARLAADIEAEFGDGT